MSAIPVELITLIASTLIGGIMQLWGQSQKNKAEQHSQMLSAMNTRAKITEKARGKINIRFQITRQIIALTAVFSVILLPKIVAVFYPEISVWISWQEFKDGFLFFTSDKDITVWKEMKGLVITPMDNHLMAAIIGLYLGREISRT